MAEIAAPPSPAKLLPATVSMLYGVCATAASASRNKDEAAITAVLPRGIQGAVYRNFSALPMERVMVTARRSIASSLGWAVLMFLAPAAVDAQPYLHMKARHAETWNTSPMPSYPA